MAVSSNVFIKFGESQLIDVHGYGVSTPKELVSARKTTLLDQDTVLNLKPNQEFPVSTNCICVRADHGYLKLHKAIFSPREEVKNNRWQQTTRKSHAMLYKEEEDDDEDEDDDDNSQNLTNLLATLERFSSRILNPLQAKSITRLAYGFHVTKHLTHKDAHQILDFLECGSPPIQDAAHILLSKYASGAVSANFIYSHCPKVLDTVLSLASDASTVEVQVSAFKVIEEMCSHPKILSAWEASLEDIVYPLLKVVLRSRSSTQQQRLACLGVLRHLSCLPSLAPKVKQDILAQLNVSHHDSKVKAAFLEVLQSNLELTKQRIASDLLDNTLIPVLTDMLVDGPCGPQQQALTLLECLAQDDTHRVSIYGSSRTVALCLLCAKHSKCRKVISTSCCVIEQLLKSRSKKEETQFLECNLESGILEGSTTDKGYLDDKKERSVSRTRKKSQMEAELWRNFDKFISNMVLLLEKQGYIYQDQNSSEIKCELSLIGTVNGDQLRCITSLIECLSNICCWSLNRPRKRNGNIENIEEIMSIDMLGNNLNNVNHNHIISIWENSGRQIMALFRQIIKRVSAAGMMMGNSFSLRTGNSPNRVIEGNTVRELSKEMDSLGLNKNNYEDSSSTSLNLSSGEYELLKALCKFVLLASLASCCIGQSQNVKKDTEEHSPSGSRPSSASHSSVSRRTQEELAEREACAERRTLRRNLVEFGVFNIMGTLAACSNTYLKAVSTAVLRLCLQPVSERASTASARRKKSSETRRPMTARPATTQAWDSRESQTINQRLFSMGKPGIGQRATSAVPYVTGVSSIRNKGASPEPVVVLDQAGTRRQKQRPATARAYLREPDPSQGRKPRPSSASRYSMFSPLTTWAERKTLFSKLPGDSVGKPQPRSQSRMSTFHLDSESLNEINRATRIRPASARVDREKTVLSCQAPSILAAPLDPGNNLSLQCCHRVVQATGDLVLKGIFSADVDVKRSSLLLLHDLVHYSTNELHMELSKMGCIPKLVDFLRINDDNELLEITGLTITRMLISSDRRLCQLFNIHGGSSLLMALLQHGPSAQLKAAVADTLTTVNNVMHPSHGNPTTASSTSSPTDIWEHIMQRWEGEDKVVEILKQFL